MVEETEGPNPFDGMSFGQAVIALRTNPELSGKFDAKFGSMADQEVDTMERARLHAMDSFYRGGINGATYLRSLSERAKMSPEDYSKAEEEFKKHGVRNPIQGALAAERGIDTKAGQQSAFPKQKDVQDEYANIVGDLAKFDLMAPVKEYRSGLAVGPFPIPSKDAAAAVGGAIVGGLPTIENAAYWPMRGATALARIGQAAWQNAAVGWATDPVVQTLSINSEVQKEFDPVRFAIAGPVAAVIGGGLAGLGEIVSRNAIKKGLSDLSIDDPTLATPSQQRLADTLEAPDFIPGAKTEKEKTPNLNPIEQTVEDATPRAREQSVAPMGDEPARAFPDKPQTPDDIPPAIKSLHTMTEELEEVFGVPIRQGRLGVKGQGVLGTFSPQSGVIHMREYPDFSVATHEVGHAIEARVPEMTNLINKFDDELRLMDYDQDPIFGQRGYEGFAEFIRLYMTNPVRAQVRAPLFFDEFTREVGAKQPEILEKLVRFQQSYYRYLNATPEEALSSIVYSPQRTIGDEVIGKLTEAKMAPTVRNVLSAGYDAIVFRDQDMVRAQRELERGIREQQKKAGNDDYVNILPTENPTLLLAEMRKAHSASLDASMNGVTQIGDLTPSGPSIAQALTTAMGKSHLLGRFDEKIYDAFGDYLVARMGIQRWGDYNQGLLDNAPLPMGEVPLTKALQKIEKEYPQFGNAADMLSAYSRNYLQKLVDVGIISQKAMDDMIAKNPFYVPLNRVVDDLTSGQASKGSSSSNAIKGFGGSMRDVIHPVSSLLESTRRFEQLIAHNRVMNALDDLADRAGVFGGVIFEKLPAKTVQRIEFDLKDSMGRAMKALGHSKDDITTTLDGILGPGPVMGSTFKTVTINGKAEPVVFYWKDGELNAARLSTEKEGFGLYEIMTKMPPAVTDLTSQLLQTVASQMVGSVVLHPAYIMRNLFRDQFGAMAFVPGYVPFYSAMRGMVLNATNDPIAQAYHAKGVAGRSFLQPKSEVVEADVKAMVNQGYNVSILKSPGELFRAFANLMTTFETATRIGAAEVVYKQQTGNTVRQRAMDAIFQRGRTQGLSDFDAMTQAVREASDLFDPTRYGSRMDMVRGITPFLGAWVASMDKAQRTMIEPIGKLLRGDIITTKDSADVKTAAWAWMSLGVVGWGLGHTWAAIFGEDDAYKNATPAIKAANFVLPIGKDKVLLIPKPWELALGFTAGEYNYARAQQEDPRAIGDFAKAVVKTFEPPFPFYGNPLIKSTVEAYHDYNSFTGRPIVPEKYKGLEPEFYPKGRYGEIGRQIGAMTGISPAKVDYWLSGMFGYYGRDMTTVGRGNDDGDPTSQLMDYTLLRSGLRDSTMVSDARDRFWKHMGRSTGDFAVAQKNFRFLTQDARNDAKAQEYYNKLPNEKKAWIVLNDAADENGRQVFKADDRKMHPFVRAGDAITIINNMRNDVLNERLVDLGTQKPIVIPPDARKKIESALGQMALAEMVNSLKIMKEPGYANRQLFDIPGFVQQIAAINPAVAIELETRYGTKKIASTRAVAEVYPQIERLLVAEGSQADLSEYRTIVKDAGGELSLENRRKTPKARRTVIPGQSAQQTEEVK